jgi:hypothetical protein
LDAIEKALADSGVSSEDSEELRKTLEKAKIATSALEKIKTQLEKGGTEKTAEEIAKSIEEQAELKQQNKNLRNQVKHVQKKCLGRGLTKPPCWADDTGKAEYIFSVALTSRGLVIHDMELLHRREEQAKLPIHGITYDKEILPDRFQEQCKPIFLWSTKQDPECRFYVHVYDKTGPKEKEIYKEHMRVLESRFYKWEVRDKRFPWALGPPETPSIYESLEGQKGEDISL